MGRIGREEAELYEVYGNTVRYQAAESPEEWNAGEAEQKGYEKGTKEPACRQQELYFELTAAGKALCLILAVIEEFLIYLSFGIRLTLAPVPVTVVLWFLLAVVTAGVLLGVYTFLVSAACPVYKKYPFHFQREQVYL